MTANANPSLTAPAPSLVDYARDQILARLRQAARLARRDLPGGLDHLREMLGDITDRIDALQIAQPAGADRPRRARSCLRFTALAAAGAEPVSEFRLVPYGEVTVERPIAGESFVFTPAHAESAKKWFEHMGRKLAIDYEHQTFHRFNNRPDGLRPAAGWIGGLEVRDDGLWAVNVTWTERAAALLRSGEYRYFSPVIYWTDEDHSDVAALGPVALTNDPAMCGVQPLAAGRSRDWADEPEGDDADDGMDDESEVAGLKARCAALAAENTLLQRQLAALEADSFVERGRRIGKIVESATLDWRTDYVRDPVAAEERLARAPVLLPPGRVLTLNQRGDVAGLPEERLAEAGVLGAAARVEAEDLAAFQRAAAAGRVVRAAAVGAER